jgi:hypothetical protein
MARRTRTTSRHGKGGHEKAFRKQKAPRTAAQYHAKSEKFKNTWDRVVSVVSKMRSEKASLQKASKEEGISPRTVKRWAGSALQKQSNGKWVAKKRNTLLKILKIPTSEGPQEIGIRDSRQATRLAHYWNALNRYLETGDSSKLKKFSGKSIKDANGAQIPFITDLQLLNRLGSFGVWRFESLYARAL